MRTYGFVLNTGQGCRLGKMKVAVMVAAALLTGCSDGTERVPDGPWRAEVSFVTVGAGDEPAGGLVPLTRLVVARDNTGVASARLVVDGWQVATVTRSGGVTVLVVDVDAAGAVVGWGGDSLRALLADAAAADTRLVALSRVGGHVAVDTSAGLVAVAEAAGAGQGWVTVACATDALLAGEHPSGCGTVEVDWSAPTGVISPPVVEATKVSVDEVGLLVALLRSGGSLEATSLPAVRAGDPWRRIEGALAGGDTEGVVITVVGDGQMEGSFAGLVGCRDVTSGVFSRGACR